MGRNMSLYGKIMGLGMENSCCRIVTNGGSLICYGMLLQIYWQLYNRILKITIEIELVYMSEVTINGTVKSR